MKDVHEFLKPYGLHYRSTVLWNLLEFDAHSGFPYETLHNLKKGMVEWLLTFLGIPGSY
jgi:hypothetical protein